MNFLIKSNIVITRTGRNRKAKFSVQPKGTNVLILRYVTEPSMQDLIHSIQRQYKTIVYSDDLSYNFKLRKDEFIPPNGKRSDLIPCSIPSCKVPAVLYHKEKPMCQIHFMAHEKTMPVIRSLNTSRNESCSCGSGRKFKSCCSKKIEHKSGRLFYQPRNI